MDTKLKKSLLLLFVAGLVLAGAVVGLEALKKHDKENWQGTAMYGIKAAPEGYKPKESKTQSLQDMRDFAFDKKKK